MPIVAPNCVRYTIVGSLAGQDCMNIIDVRITDDILAPREEEIVRVAGDIINNWTDHILPLVVNDYTALSVRWVDLDTPSGTTGSRSSTDDTTWPLSGAGSSAPLPNAIYAKMQKILEGKNRVQRNGTLRLSGLAEVHTSDVAPNTINEVNRAEFNAGFENFKDGINEGGLTGTINLVVIHTVNGVATGDSDIASFSCAPVVGTLRRRMPGYGS